MMTVSTEYEFDLSVVEAVIRRLPETFDTYDVSQHPDMIRAHTLLSTHRAWHNVVGMCLARQVRNLEPLPARRRGMQMWRKVKAAPRLEDLSAPTMLMPVLREGA